MTNHHSNCKVYVLSGASNAGKTTALNQLAWLVSKLPGAVRQEGPEPVETKLGDSQYCFKLPVEGRQRTIGISTGGDTGDVISRGFAKFDEWHCDMCFIASKTSGGSVQTLENETRNRGMIPSYCFLINERECRTQAAIEQAAAAFLCSLVTKS